jgi:epidermal growth factor receptor substrate 15
MADITGGELSRFSQFIRNVVYRTVADLGADHPILNLTPEENRAFQYLFKLADTEKLGVITGEVAVKFFERTKLAPAVLGEIWQIADTENRGLLTSPGFCQVLRLIGHYQAGRDPSPELAFRREYLEMSAMLHG